MSLFPAIDALFLKYNENHDELGRFAVGGSYGVPAGEALRNPSTEDLARMLASRPDAEIRIVVKEDTVLAGDAWTTLHNDLAKAGGLDSPAVHERFTIVTGKAVRIGDARWQIGHFPVEIFDGEFKLPKVLPPPLARIVTPIATKFLDDIADRLIGFKFNENHDERGRFAAGSGGAAAAQLSWEAAPGRTTGNMPEFHEAPLDQRQAYQTAVANVLQDAKGNDRIVTAMGLLPKPSFAGPGVFEGTVNPGAQAQAIVGTDDAGMGVSQDSRDRLDVGEATRGRLLRQDAAAWHQPTFGAGLTPEASNMVDVGMGRPLTNDEAVHVTGTLEKEMGTVFFSPIASPGGFRLMNVPDLSGMSNTEFQTRVDGALAKTTLPALTTRPAYADGNYISNDWKEHPNGEGYSAAITATNRPDLQRASDRLYATLGPQLGAVEDSFAARNGWTVNPATRFWQSSVAAAGVAVKALDDLADRFIAWSRPS